MSNLIWKILSALGIRRDVEADLPPIPYATPEQRNRTPDVRGKPASPTSVSRMKRSVTFSPEREKIPQYDMTSLEPKGQTPIRLIRELAARASPATSGELNAHVDQLQEAIDDLRGQCAALESENKRLIKENKILREELSAVRMQGAVDSGALATPQASRGTPQACKSSCDSAEEAEAVEAEVAEPKGE